MCFLSLYIQMLNCKFIKVCKYQCKSHYTWKGVLSRRANATLHEEHLLHLYLKLFNGFKSLKGLKCISYILLFSKCRAMHSNKIYLEHKKGVIRTTDLPDPLLKNVDTVPGHWLRRRSLLGPAPRRNPLPSG